jgi:glycosyltransferase involved in cell wall biosynthesis
LVIAKNKLAIYMHGLYAGGAERIVLNLAKEICNRGYSVDLVLAKAVGPFMDQIPPSVRLIDLKASRVVTSLPALVDYLRCEGPIALLSGIDYTNIIAIMAQRVTGIPKRLVIVEHNTFSKNIQEKKLIYRMLMPQLMKVFYPLADCIVAVSEGVSNDLIKVLSLSGNNIEVIYNPIVTPNLIKLSNEPLDDGWFRPGQPPVLLSVGRLTRQKDFITLLNSFSQVRAKRPVHLIILGEGEERPLLESTIRQLGLKNDVRMPGHISNPYNYMSNADLFVLSSKWEGLPTVLVEALHCGLPVISTDCPSGPREILRAGKFGQLVPVGDTVALTKGIEFALDGHAILPTEESWKPYQLENIVDQYLECIFGC